MIVSWSVGRPHVRRAVHTFRFSSAATGQRVGVPPLISGWPAREKSPTSFTHTRVALALSPSLYVSPSDSIRPGAVAEASARCGCSRFLVQSYLHEGRCDDMEYIDSVDVPRFSAGRHAHSALSRFTSARLLRGIGWQSEASDRQMCCRSGSDCRNQLRLWRHCCMDNICINFKTCRCCFVAVSAFFSSFAHPMGSLQGHGPCRTKGAARGIVVRRHIVNDSNMFGFDTRDRGWVCVQG